MPWRDRIAPKKPRAMQRAQNTVRCQNSIWSRPWPSTVPPVVTGAQGLKCRAPAVISPRSRGDRQPQRPPVMLRPPRQPSEEGKALRKTPPCHLLYPPLHIIVFPSLSLFSSTNYQYYLCISFRPLYSRGISHRWDIERERENKVRKMKLTNVKKDNNGPNNKIVQVIKKG